MTEKTNKYGIPSVLAFSRKIETSDALMSAGLWDDKDKKEDTWENIKIHEKSNRATKSQYGVKDDEVADSNLVCGDDAFLPFSTDTLKVSFTIKFLGNIEQPVTCNDETFTKKLKEKVGEYKEKFGFKELAKRYVNNLVNARFLWRNRVVAEKISIHIINKVDNKYWKFEDAYKFDLNFDNKEQDNNIKEITDLVIKSFTSGEYLLLEVKAFAKIGEGQHIFPSQKMILDIKKGEKSKHLYKINDYAGMHSEKIGNAIRTIDTWYPDGKDCESSKPPIAIEPYGAVTKDGVAYRKSISKKDFYNLLLNWLNEKEVSEEDQHFIVANFIRGGVFSGESKDKKNKKDK